jgi:OOP family OmpA-OmpF porin
LALFAAPAAQAADNLVRKVDSFDFLVDYSGSMMMKDMALKANKMDVAKDVLTRVNAGIPDLGYQGSLHTFAPVGTLVPLAAWNQAAMAGRIATLQNDLPVFGRMTPMGTGLANLAGAYSAMARPTAIVMVSDGASNTGIAPVAEAATIYQSNPGLCFHVISLADSAEGQAILDKIAALKQCTVMVKAADLLADQAAVDKFVADVFYTAGGITETSIVLRGVNFAFDSYALDSTAKGILDQVATILKAQPAKITLQGWTDYIGTDAYNKVLSQRRADSVRDYLVQQGVPAASLATEGMGKSYKFDNKTDEGRYLNRRTELLFNE